MLCRYLVAANLRDSATTAVKSRVFKWSGSVFEHYQELDTIAASSVTRAERMTGGGWCMHASANFARLVLGCINADFCNQIRQYQFECLKHFSRSTSFTHLCTAPISIVQRNISSTKYINGIFMTSRCSLLFSMFM